MAHKTKKKMANKNFRKPTIPYTRLHKTKKDLMERQQTKHKNKNDFDEYISKNNFEKVNKVY